MSMVRVLLKGCQDTFFLDLAKEEGLTQQGAVLSYTYGRGYHYSVKNKNTRTLPSNCIQVVHNRMTTTFTTLNMIRYNDRLNQLEKEILNNSEIIVNQLLAEIRPFVPALHNCVEFVSMVDFLASLAYYSLNLSSGGE
jgi:DNA mismatch repair ATPase MutS